MDLSPGGANHACHVRSNVWEVRPPGIGLAHLKLSKDSHMELDGLYGLDKLKTCPLL